MKNNIFFLNLKIYIYSNFILHQKREHMNRDEKKYLQWASKNHLILAIASIINSILIVLFSIVLAKVVKNSVSLAKI